MGFLRRGAASGAPEQDHHHVLNCSTTPLKPPRPEAQLEGHDLGRYVRARPVRAVGQRRTHAVPSPPAFYLARGPGRRPHQVPDGLGTAPSGQRPDPAVGLEKATGTSSSAPLPFSGGDVANCSSGARRFDGSTTRSGGRSPSGAGSSVAAIASSTTSARYQPRSRHTQSRKRHSLRQEAGVTNRLQHVAQHLAAPPGVTRTRSSSPRQPPEEGAQTPEWDYMEGRLQPVLS